MHDIALQAKVGKGTLYEYFRGKEELFACLVLTVARESLETLASLGATGDPVAELREAVRYTVEVALGESLDLYRLFFDFWGVAAHYRSDTQAQLRAAQDTWMDFMGDLIRAGQRTGAVAPEIDVEQHVSALGAAVDGMSLRMVVHGVKVDLAAYTCCLQGLFVNGILTDDGLRGASILSERNI